MTAPVDLVKLDLTAQYERGEPINIAAWVRSHPEHRDELLDYWLWLTGTPRVTDPSVTWPPCSVCGGERIEVSRAAAGRYVQCQSCALVWGVDEADGGYYLTAVAPGSGTAP